MVEASNVGFLEQDTDGPPALNYVNFIVVNGGVVMPRFGNDEADAKAKTIIQKLSPERGVVQVQLHWIALTGEGFHCASQQVPLI